MKKVLVLISLLLSTNLLAEGISIPNNVFTPGSILTTDVNVICVPNYSKSVRDVSGKMKNKIYGLYDIPKNERGTVEGRLTSKIDHLIPLSIGGSNDITNLWPHYYNPDDGYGVLAKNKIENRLHKLVCNGEISVEEAQSCIVDDWRECYHKFIQ